ncbi:MAG: NADPH-dependent FMN reductase [Methanosphaera sp. rholeuAM130]|nr:MAG: NADPH-dependent FMN reductase [Methanosphaera sp. rholeuAM130]
MKVLLVNGSTRKEGCTYTALNEIKNVLDNEDNIDTEVFWIGDDAVYGCRACGSCQKLGKCVYDDVSNILAQKMKDADAIVLGSPVYFASINGSFGAALDKAFYQNSSIFENKIGASVVSCRRGGAGSAFDRLNKYFTISRMPIASGQYWNAVHGQSPEEVKQDIEGMQQMRDLARSIIWMLNNLANTQVQKREEKTFMNFIH